MGDQIEQSYELIIIGAGPGGYVSAIRAAQLGIKTALIEKAEVGGTCLNKGCIPTKTFLHVAEVMNQIQKGTQFGITTSKPEVDVKQMYSYKNQVVTKLRDGVEQLLKANKVELIHGKGKIIQANTVRVMTKDGTSNLYQAKHIIVATGSKPALPPIKGINLEGVYTSDDLLLHQRKLLESIVIIGGGVIGVEFANIYQKLGCQVTIIEAMNKLLPTMDRDISQNLLMLMKKRGIQVITKAKVLEIKKEDEGLQVIYEYKGTEQIITTNGVLISVGRKANIEDIFADDIAPEMEKGRIKTNEDFLTNQAGIYAIGDVTSKVQLAHVASSQGIGVVEKIAGLEPHVDLTVIPTCVYVDPEIGCVGMTGEKAKAQGIPIRIGKSLTSTNGKSMISMEERGFVKIVVQEETGEILGAQFMCARATEMIGEMATAIANQMTIHQLGKAMKAHPTIYEVIGEAIEDLKDGAIHGVPKKKR